MAMNTAKNQNHFHGT